MTKTINTGSLTWKRTHNNRMECPPYSVVKFDGPNGTFYSAHVTIEEHVKVLNLGIRSSEEGGFEAAAKLCEHYHLTSRETKYEKPRRGRTLAEHPKLDLPGSPGDG